MLSEAITTLTPSSSTIPTSVGVAFVMAYALDFLKRVEQVPKINYYTTKLNSWLRLLTSGIGTLGVSWVWSAAGAGHQLLITIPAWSVLGAGLWHWAISYGTQHLVEIQLAQRPIAQKATSEQVAPKA